MKNYIYVLLMFVVFPALSAEDFYSLSAKKIDGENLNFSDYRGKKLMIVNVASYCGYTYQYAELQKLYEEYGGDNFEIIAFPANNFSNQEPGSDEDIEKFCNEKYNVTFTMMSKISVVGFDKHPVYQWLTEASKNGQVNQEVMWNFQKYCINEDGKIWKIFGSKVSPLNSEIKGWLTQGANCINDNNNNLQEFRIYPNPTNDFLTLAAESIDGDIIIYNTLGIEQFRFGNANLDKKSVSINISSLPVGTYFIKAGNITKVFVKI